MASTEKSKERETNDAASGAAHELETQGPPRPSLWREYFESGVVTLIMALFFMTFVAQAAEVPSASMQNTIYVGDHFLINKFIFAPGTPAPFLPQRDIRRGDIIIFKYPSEMDNNEQVIRYQTLYIKRVIGLPGETIEVRGADVLINGRALPEHRITADVHNQANDKATLEILADPAQKDGELPYRVYYDPETLKRPETKSSYFQYAVNGQPAVVPEGHYFVMGDNRDNSLDSRRWGFVPREMIVGRAMFVLWSYDESAPSNGNPILNFFRNTRWRRTGTLLK